jgi:hypothetical protein
MFKLGFDTFALDAYFLDEGQVPKHVTIGFV